MANYGFTIYRDAVREGAPTGDESSRASRVRALREGVPRQDGAYVLYWMQMYLRGSGNAALDEAVRRANRLGLPLLVYQGLNPEGARALGRLLWDSGGSEEPIESVAAAYESGFGQALQQLPSTDRHTNVLQHLAGYVSDAIDDGDRAELSEAIDGFRSGLVPLIVPVVLLRHYVRRLEVDYLADQVYLEPHPHELMLLNHV